MADIKSKGRTLDLRAGQPAQTKSAAAVTAAARTAQPAGQFHGKQVSGAAVLDLRAKAPATSSAASAPPSPAPIQPKPALRSVVAPPAAAPEEPAASTLMPPAPPPLPSPAVASPTIAAPTPVVAPKKLAVPTLPPPPTPQPKPAASSKPSEPLSPLFNKFPANPVVGQPAANVLPAAVGTQVDTMKAQAATAPPPAQPRSPALRQAITAAKQSTATPNVLKIGAALIAIGVMTGVVWLQNSPKLAFRNDATQAGIDASLPTYIPSSYHQNGAVGVSPGQLTLNFSSSNSSEPLTIVQRASSWDTNALRTNYLSQQTTSFLAVQGQGLTIYLYGDQADWINHGVWYQLSGTSKLGREDILKIAYGL